MKGYRLLNVGEEYIANDEFQRADGSWILLDEANVNRAKSCGLHFQTETGLPIRRKIKEVK